MSTDKTYNGWSNYETWCVSMWLDNDEATSSDVNGIILKGVGGSVYEAAQNLEEYVKELAEMTCPGVVEGASFVADMFGAALGETNFVEIIESTVDGLDGVDVDDHELVGDLVEQ